MNKKYAVISVQACWDFIGDKWGRSFIPTCRYSGKEAKERANRLADFGAPYPVNVLVLKKHGIKGWKVSAIHESFVWGQADD